MSKADQFIEVNVWSWTPFFAHGDYCITTSLTATEEQVRNYIETRTNCGNGNWKSDSLKSRVTKMKRNQASLTWVGS